MCPDMRLLVVDDDENDRFLLKHGFLRAGINVSIEMVNGGEAAVQYLSGAGAFNDRAKFPLPNLVLLDVKMPILDGFEVLRWIRAQPGLRRIPVVFLSSSALNRDVDLAHELGANGYSMKPGDRVGMENLVRGIEAYWFRCQRYPRVGTVETLTHPGMPEARPFSDVLATGEARAPQDERDTPSEEEECEQG